MGSRMNFVDVMNDEVFNPKQPSLGFGLPLTRQSSVFSLTFDEFQNSWGGGIGKDFRSMNMDELLKNICTAEDTHSVMATNAVNMNSNGGLQRQGSITLPRTISQKRVDDVWKELMKDDDTGNGGASGVPQRQQTLGEMTLEEFLARAGVVREEPQQQVERLDNFNGGFYGFGSNESLGSARNGFGPNQPQQVIQKQERPFPKQTTIVFSNTVDLENHSQPLTQCHEVKPSILGVQNLPMSNTVAAASPGSQMTPDLTPKSTMDASLPPVPYLFGQARKIGPVLEKMIERRQKSMIKNRESTARSRARKQAYMLELEAKVAQLKELNGELQRKQVEIIEKQKKQLLEPMHHQPWGCKRQCLQRTLTGPW